MIGLQSSDLYVCRVHLIRFQSNYLTLALIQPEYSSVCLRAKRLQTKHLRSRINCERTIEQARCDGLSVIAMLTANCFEFWLWLWKKAVFPFPNRTHVRSQIHKPPTGVNSRHNNGSYAQCPLMMLALHKPVSLKLTELLTLRGAVSAEPRDHRTTCIKPNMADRTENNTPVHGRNFNIKILMSWLQNFILRVNLVKWLQTVWV